MASTAPAMKYESVMSTIISSSAKPPMDNGSLAKNPANENGHARGVRSNCA